MEANDGVMFFLETLPSFNECEALCISSVLKTHDIHNSNKFRL